MSKLLDRYVEANLVKMKSSWYYVDNKSIGRGQEAKANLQKLIDKGKVKNLDIADDAPEKSPEVLPPSNSMPQVEGDEANADLLPVNTPKPFINPALTNNLELPENLESLFEPLMAGVGDIESRKKGGRYKIYVFGIDSRLKDHPFIKKCRYVFRHRDKKMNVRSGSTVFNKEGWAVLSKKNISNDPRTGKPWLTVARDDTPDEDFFTVNDRVLCYAEKAQYERKKGKMAMECITKTAKVADSRQENAERMAAMSKTDPKQSMAGYMSANKADHSVAKEQLEQNQNFSSNEAQEYIDSMNAMGSRDTDVEQQISKLRGLVNSGKVGKTIKDARPLTIDNL